MSAPPTGSAEGAPGRGRLAAVFGGTGFLGRQVVRHLLDHGFSVRIASRHPEHALSLLPDRLGVEAARADVHDAASVAAALVGCFGVVNAVSLNVEHGSRESFRAVHVESAWQRRCMARRRVAVAAARSPFLPAALLSAPVT